MPDPERSWIIPRSWGVSEAGIKLCELRSPRYDRFSQRTRAEKELAENLLSVLSLHQEFRPYPLRPVSGKGRGMARAAATMTDPAGFCLPPRSHTFTTAIGCEFGALSPFIRSVRTSRSLPRARDKLDMTVPAGQPAISAILYLPSLTPIWQSFLSLHILITNRYDRAARP
jgi:hypothetical protein